MCRESGEEPIRVPPSNGTVRQYKRVCSPISRGRSVCVDSCICNKVSEAIYRYIDRYRTSGRPLVSRNYHRGHHLNILTSTNINNNSLINILISKFCLSFSLVHLLYICLYYIYTLCKIARIIIYTLFIYIFVKDKYFIYTCAC